MITWKDIEGYEGIYQIGVNGEVKALSKTIRGRFYPEAIKVPFITRMGYFGVSLHRGGTGKSFSVHRLIGVAFISNPEKKPCINHINGVKTDNRIENLEWCTSSENRIHAFKAGLAKGLLGEKNPMYGKTGALNPMFGKKGVSRFGKENPMYGRRGALCPFFGIKRPTPKWAKIVLDTQTGIFYDSAREAAEAKNIPWSSLRSWLNGSNPNNKTSLIYA